MPGRGIIKDTVNLVYLLSFCLTIFGLAKKLKQREERPETLEVDCDSRVRADKWLPLEPHYLNKCMKEVSVVSPNTHFLN